ncbi:MAG: ABC transporter substrate-binding protein [Christensenellales bacterium]|jgi:spermidine/putrescine transport system substrate-binding protein
MKRILSLTLMIVLALSSLLLFAGCERKPVVHVYNWEDYIDPDVLDIFEEEYGVKVKYSGFTTNEDMFALVQAGATTYDVIFPSDYIIERMIKDDLLLPIDYGKVTNFQHLSDEFQSGLDFDPESTYSVPYMWGTVGILYNTTMVDGPVDSWDVLWDPQYQGNIFMLDSIRDAMGIALKRAGYSLNSRDPQEVEEAKQMLIGQKPLVLAYLVDQAKDKMVRGEAALALMWSGDAAYAIDQNPDLEYAIPKEGSNIWVDSMIVPKNAPNPDAAMDFINFMCRPDIAAMNAEYIGYSTPNESALELLDPDISEDQRFYPDNVDELNLEYFHDLGDALKTYNDMWSEIKSAN